jgi:hypothetical protein
MRTMHSKWLFGAVALLGLVLVLHGCASYGPGSLAGGTTIADATRVMGLPTGEYLLANGGKRLEYARGPMGKHTFMLDFDAQGRLVAWAQVLTEARFNAVRVGTPSDELLMTLGHPSERSMVGLQHLAVWSYRYDAVFCQWFQVSLDAQGRVADTSYGPDPMCEPEHLSDAP